jgi:putative flippase GtrA
MHNSINKQEFKRFIRFGIVGIIGSLIDFGFLNLFTIVFNIPYVLSSVFSFSLAVINNFVLNRIWTFPASRKDPIANQLIQFGLVSVVGLLIRTPLLAWLEKVLIPLAEKWVPNFLTPTIVGHNVGLAIGIGVVMLWNYFANRFWTFKNTPA